MNKALPDWSFNEADLLAMKPARSIMEEFMANVAAKLAEGVPVTVISMGKPVATYYPGGLTQHYDEDGNPLTRVATFPHP